MSDPLRTDGTRTHGGAPPGDRDAKDRDEKIEQLLLVGLDHYFAAQYEHAINVWTRALFLDRSHARARAYIERARSALAERQRESEELLQHGVDAFRRGDGDEARRLLQAAIDGGAPTEEALAVLDRLNRLETTGTHAAAPRIDRAVRPHTPVPDRPARSVAHIGAGIVLVVGVLAAAAYAVTAGKRVDWWSLVGLQEVPAARGAALVTREQPLALPRRGETALARARTFAASGHLRDALATLDEVRA